MLEFRLTDLLQDMFQVDWLMINSVAAVKQVHWERTTEAVTAED